MDTRLQLVRQDLRFDEHVGPFSSEPRYAPVVRVSRLGCESFALCISVVSISFSIIPLYPHITLIFVIIIIMII